MVIRLSGAHPSANVVLPLGLCYRLDFRCVCLIHYSSIDRNNPEILPLSVLDGKYIVINATISHLQTQLLTNEIIYWHCALKTKIIIDMKLTVGDGK